MNAQANFSNSEKISLALFLLNSVVHLYAQISNDLLLSNFTKPLIIILLSSFAFFYAKNNNFKIDKNLSLALFFCWLGDCLLMLQLFNANFFIFGLLAFLIGHIFYILLNIKNAKKVQILDLIAFLPMLLWAIYLLSKIKSAFFIPVLFYSFALCALYFSTLLTREKLNKNNWLIFFIGVILFIVSDSMIAINKFIKPFDNAGLLIMLTYIVAQFLIVFVNLKIMRQHNSNLINH